jgi:septal ring factor EnvC (AmiA/AmiB activator)
LFFLHDARWVLVSHEERIMTLRMLVTLVCGLAFLILATPAKAEEKHEKLRHALKELEEAKEHLKFEKRHEQVEKAHKALKEAIKYVKESDHKFGGRRDRLIERLERLDKQLEKDWVNARKALDEAIDDIKFAIEH